MESNHLYHFAMIGRLFQSGHNGESMLRSAIIQVSYFFCFLNVSDIFIFQMTSRPFQRIVLLMMRKTFQFLSTQMDACPHLPNATEYNQEGVKILQTMLWEYCTKHIHKNCSDYLSIYDIAILEYVLGKTNAKISWARVTASPSTWIELECTPEGFEWADPSKICIANIFLLLQHWRERQRQHLAPLIWASTCPLLKDASSFADEWQEYQSHQSQDDSSTEDYNINDRSAIFYICFKFNYLVRLAGPATTIPTAQIILRLLLNGMD